MILGRGAKSWKRRGRGNCIRDAQTNKRTNESFSKDTKMAKTWLGPSEGLGWDEVYVLVFPRI